MTVSDGIGADSIDFICLGIVVTDRETVMYFRLDCSIV